MQTPPTAAQLNTTLCGIVSGGLLAGLGTGATQDDINTAAASGALAAAALLAAVPFEYPGLVATRTQQAAAIFAALESAKLNITPTEITAAAATSASCLAAILSAVGPTGVQPSVTILQIAAAVEAFAGLALGLSSITGTQITEIAALSATSAAAVWAAAT